MKINMPKPSKSARTKKQTTATAKRIAKKAGRAKAGTSKSEKMTLGRGWRLISKDGKTMSATLLVTHDLGDRYLAVFKSVR